MNDSNFFIYTDNCQKIVFRVQTQEMKHSSY